MNVRYGSLPPLRYLNTADLLKRPLYKVTFSRLPDEVAVTKPVIKKRLLYQKVEDIMRHAIGTSTLPRRKATSPKAAPLVSGRKRLPKQLRVVARTAAKTQRNTETSYGEELASDTSLQEFRLPNYPTGLSGRTTIFSRLQSRSEQEGPENQSL